MPSMTLADAPDVLDCRMIADICGLGDFGYQTIAKKCGKEIPARKVGKKWVVLKESLINYLKGKNR